MAVDTNSEKPLIRGFEHSVNLPVFEGPLDLLLFLIRKNEIDIYDIPIERITHQYLEFLKSMETRQLEMAGEFFVMAATLMHIKSRMLLPREDQAASTEEEEDSDIDPRWELVQQLIQYRKFKDAAGHLGDLMDEARNILFRDYATKSEELPERPLKPTDAVSLWNTFNLVLRRLSEKIIIGEIHDETITVAERMEDILKEIDRRPRFLFSELLQGTVSIPFVVSTFLALLELTRLNKLEIHQDAAFADIHCQAITE